MRVDDVHFNMRLEQDRPCCLVIVGVRLDGAKELATWWRPRESTDPWADLLCDLRRPETREQCDRTVQLVHQVANVLTPGPSSGRGAGRDPTEDQVAA